MTRYIIEILEDIDLIDVEFLEQLFDKMDLKVNITKKGTAGHD